VRRQEILICIGRSGAAGLALVLMAQPTWADGVEGKNNRLPSTTPQHHLREMPRPQTSAKDLLVQSAVVQVVGVKLTPTDAGIEIALETANGQVLQGKTTSEGNNLVINIPNAQLQLPEGREFRQDNPFEGIASVTVTAPTSNSIRVSVTGIDGVPTGEVVPSQTGLIVGVTPEELEITVTAQKREENVQEVPISITTFSREDLEDSQINSLQGIANSTPNFSIFSQGGRTFTFYSIRGLSNGNFLSRDAVAFYIDDVPFDGGRFIDLNLIDLERVEVLRGPQSTLYGRNSQAGVVNVITRQPTDDPEVRYGASYGTYDSRNLQLSLSGPLVPEQLSFRIAGDYTARDGFTKNTFLDERVGERSGVTGRGQLRWTPGEDWTVSFNAFASYNDDGDAVYSILGDSNPFRIQRNIDGFNELSTNTQALKIAYDGEGFRATAITARRFSNQNFTTDGDFTPNAIARYLNKFDSTVWSQELRFQSPENADRFQWLLGGYYESRDFNTTIDGFELTAAGAAAFGFPSPVAGTDRTSAQQNQTTYAGFGQIDYKPTEPLTLTAGLRYESATTYLDRRRNYELEAGGVVPIGETVNDAEESGSELLPRFAVEYAFNPSLRAYASVTRGYKPKGLNYRADTDSVRRFRAETSWNYEVGLKSSWFDDRLIANLALFTTQVDDYQVALPDITGQFRNITNAGADIKGLELELRGQPIEGLDLIAGFGYVDGEYTDYTNPFTGQRFDGNKLPYAPEFTYNLAAQYRSPGGLFARLELVGFGTFYFDDANDLKQDPFALVNARIGYEGDNYGIYLFANNLFDTEYVTSVFAFPPLNIASYGDPTTVGVQLRANF